jgi:hypothetical protein
MRVGLCGFDFSRVCTFREYSKEAEDFFEAPNLGDNHATAYVPYVDDEIISSGDDEPLLPASRHRTLRQMDDFAEASDDASDASSEDEMELADHSDSSADDENSTTNVPAKGKGKEPQDEGITEGGAGGVSARQFSARPVRAASAKRKKYMDPVTDDDDYEGPGGEASV